VYAVTVELRVELPGHSQRGDMELARTVRRTLEWMSNLPDGRIKVMVDGGWITLSGEVDWDYQRRAATAAVQALMGVAGVIDAITLKQAVASSAVAQAITAALARGAEVDSRRIHVAIAGQQVTLTGQVPNWSERELAQHAAWNAPGVATVIDRLTVLA
jgi:osmotically-inducible protein OsmY